MTSRRTFIKVGAGAGVGLILPSTLWPFGQSPSGLAKFIQPLPLPGAGGIPVASPTNFGGVDHYNIDIIQFNHQFHPQLPKASKVWGYNPKGNAAPGYLGGIILAQANRAVRVRYANHLPSTHPLPVDETIPGVTGTARNRMSPHLHGGKSDWTADGSPFNWFDPQGGFGPGITDLVKRGKGEVELYYPNQSSARMMWYHDHALGLTRLNAYAGVASAYLLGDDFEATLIRLGILPTRDIPLVLQDKTFVDGSDPNYVWGSAGDLWYPYRYETTNDPDSCAPIEPGRWDYGGCATPAGVVMGRLPEPSCVPEFFGDTPVVNGAAYPYLNVEPRHYRFRFLNASQARFFNLQLYYASPGKGTEVDQVQLEDGRVIPDPRSARPGPRMIQIATEGGFLPFPVVLNDPPQPIEFDNSPTPTNGNATRYTLLLAPGERAEVVVDFSKVPPDSVLLLYNDAPAPFPGGDERNDYYTGAPDLTREGGARGTLPGVGANTRTLMQFRLVPRVGAADPPSMNLLEAEALTLRRAGAAAAGSAMMVPMPALPARSAVGVRNLTLNEDFDEFGRLIQMLGTDQVFAKNSQGQPGFGQPYEAAPTEVVRAGSTEIWRIFNLTGDTHPIHFHLVDVRVLSRRPFVASIDPGGKLAPSFTGPARGPDANERGFKETVRMNPGEMTEVLVTFDLPRNLPYSVPFSPRLKKHGIDGYEYVWHCHILEHEEHDMMRPMVIRP